MDGNVCAQRGGCCCLEQPGGTYDEIFLLWNIGYPGQAGDPAIGTQGEVEVVSPVKQAKSCLEEVVAIAAASCDMQKEVDFCRCGAVVQRR